MMKGKGRRKEEKNCKDFILLLARQQSLSAEQ